MNEFEGEQVVGRDLPPGGGVHRLRVAVAVEREALAAHVAGEDGDVDVARLLADRGEIVEIAEGAELHAIFDAVDLLAGAGAEIDGAAIGEIAEQGRGRAAIDVDAGVGVRVGEVGARQAVGLGDRETVLQHDDVAHAEAVARGGTADRERQCRAGRCPA